MMPLQNHFDQNQTSGLGLYFNGNEVKVYTAQEIVNKKNCVVKILNSFYAPFQEILNFDREKGREVFKVIICKDLKLSFDIETGEIVKQEKIDIQKRNELRQKIDSIEHACTCD
jgi:hypothetical protein